MVGEYLQALVVILGIGAITVFILGKLRISSVVGFLLAGIVIGPSGFNLIGNSHDIEVLAELGVVLLMFTIGLEFSLKNLFQLKSIVLGGGASQVLLTIVLISVVSYFFYGQTLNAGIFQGFLAALSSTAIVFKLLLDRGEMNSPHGRFSVGILIFQDLCVVPFMLLIPVLSGNSADQNILVTVGKAFLVIGLILLASRWLVPRLLRHIVAANSRELFIISIMTLCLGTALLTSQMGLSLALGAFVAGMIISESEYAAQAVSDILPFKESFTSLFFISIGMLLDLKALAGNPGGIVTMVLIIVMIKVAMVASSSLLLGGSLKTSFITGLYLFQIGEFSFVLALEGKKQGLISNDLYQAFLAASIITMVLTPFFVRVSERVARWAVTKTPLKLIERGRHKAQGERYPGNIRDHVVVIGFGLNGGNLARVLGKFAMPYVALECNSRTVRSAKRKGEPIYYGDATSAEILHKIGIETASVAVIAISDAASTRRIVQLARSVNPNLYIIARTKYVSEVENLKRLGANDVIPEEFETSIEIFSKVLHYLHVPVNDIRDHIDTIRGDNYLALRAVKLPRRYFVEREDMLRNIGIETYRIRRGSIADETTLSDLDLRVRTGVTVIGIERNGKVHRMPSASLRLTADDVLLFIGRREDMDCATEYLDSSPDKPVQCQIKREEP